MPHLRIADFTEFPGGRFAADGPFSGEQYRKEILGPALLAAIRSNEILTVEIDGTKGYGSSFLEEAFGGLIRTGIVSRKDADRHLRISTEDRLYEPYKQLIMRYLKNARPDFAVA
jgi:hypothetical protein